ncbi:hypothetical protein [Pseudonocardia sp. 73-21]|uniref:hypothetical protein n=1 Tax=Pseudonocardia sp. 73-21 TaxID=1895809 RepID=UPI002602DD2D|nr:hypothetical protein [Pseudonocardia sp. 73-21]
MFATLSDDQRVQRAEGASLPGEDEDVGRGAFTAPVPGRQLCSWADTVGCVRVSAAEPVIKQPESGADA